MDTQRNPESSTNSPTNEVVELLASSKYREDTTTGAAFYEEQKGNRLSFSLPRYPEFPDGSSVGTVSGILEGSKFTITSIRVTQDQENKGYGSALISRLKDDPRIDTIIANPSEEASLKNFYPKNGFYLDNGMFVWKSK